MKTKIEIKFCMSLILKSLNSDCFFEKINIIKKNLIQDIICYFISKKKKKKKKKAKE